MSGLPLNGGTPLEFVSRIKIEGFEVSCVAPNPFQAGFCFGSDDGKVKFTNEAGTPLLDMNGSPSGEAINGIANCGTSIAVSSRQEVTLRSWTLDRPNHLAVLVAPHGAHGICSTPGGYYVAPLGRTGIMMLRADSRQGDPVGVVTTEKEGMSFYQVGARQGRDGKDQIICAARQGGIGIADVRWTDNAFTMRTATSPGFDAIDACFVGGKAESPALAAVGLDGSLVLARDMLHTEQLITVKFNAVKGRAYRLLSVRGHLFLLTSSALYGLMNLGNRLLHGTMTETFTTPIFAMPMEAVDVSLIGDRWLVVVMPDEVLRLDLDLVHDNIPAGIQHGETRNATIERVEGAPESVDNPWTIEDIRTGSRELAGVP